MIKRLLESIRIKNIKKTDDKSQTNLRHYYRVRYNVEIGKYTYGYNIQEIGRGSSIGSFCSIASGVKIGQMNHPMQYVSTHPFLYYSSRGFISRDIETNTSVGAVVEDDVWIGNNATVLPGVTIGRGAVIAAGCVVTKDVPPYAVWGGVPGRLMKWRFEDEDIREQLLKIDWPSLDDERIKRAISYLYEPAQFIKVYEKGLI